MRRSGGSKQAHFYSRSPSTSPDHGVLKPRPFLKKNRRQIMDLIQTKEPLTSQSTLRIAPLGDMAMSLKNIHIDKDIKTLETRAFDEIAHRNTYDTIAQEQNGIAECEQLLTDDGDTTVNEESILSIPSSPPLTPCKKVAFSSDVEEESMASSSPLKSPYKPKSILKQTLLKSDNIASIEEVLKKDLANCWPDGYVLHVPENYLNKAKVVRTCVSVLKNVNCDKKYEIFATLNHLIKQSSNCLNTSFSLDSVYNLIEAIEFDLSSLKLELKAEVSPFRLRISSQGIKLLSSIHKLVSNNDSVNKSLTCILHIMKSPFISKSLASSIIQFCKSIDLKDFSQTRIIIDGVINMRYFVSSTVICERLNILSRIIIGNPMIVVKGHFQMTKFVIGTILNTDVPGYSKIIALCSHVLNQMSKYLEYQWSSQVMINKFLEYNVTEEYTAFRIPTDVGEDNDTNQSINSSLINALTYLGSNKLGKQAIDIWFSILYLISFKNKDFFFATWDYFNDWLHVFNKNFELEELRQHCIDKWNVIIYSFQISEFKNDGIALEHGLKLLSRQFKAVMSDDEYRTMYYKLFYAIQWKLKHGKMNATMIKSSIRYILIPLKAAPVSINIEPILNRIFNIDTPKLSQIKHQFSDPESVVWVMDTISWKQVLEPINEVAFENNIDLICELNLNNFQKYSFEMSCELLTISLYQQLHYLNNKNSHKIYHSEVIKLVHHMIIEILEIHEDLLINAKGGDAKLIFKLIQDADIELIFVENGDDSLLKSMANQFSKCSNIEFIVEFISICLTKFNSDLLFGAIITSDIFKNLKLLKKACSSKSFPPFLNYWVRLDKLEKANNQDLKNSDPSLLLIAYKFFFSTYLKESFNGDEFIKRVNIESKSIVEYGIYKYFDEGFLLFIFDMILHGFIGFDKQEKFFKVVTLKFFKFILHNSTTIECDKFENIISSLPNNIPEDWCESIISETRKRLYPEIQFKPDFVDVLNKIKNSVGKKTINDFNLVCLKLGVESPFKPEPENNDEYEEVEKLRPILLNSDEIRPIENLNGRRQTRSMTNNFEQETVLKLRKRQRSFEPSPVKKHKGIDLTNEKEERKNVVINLIKSGLEEIQAEQLTKEGNLEDNVTEVELVELQAVLEKINNKKLNAHSGNFELLTKQLITLLDKLTK